MEQEHIDEIKREETQQQREEHLMQWIEDNKADLINMYIDDKEDEFIDYCMTQARDVLNGR